MIIRQIAFLFVGMLFTSGCSNIVINNYVGSDAGVMMSDDAAPVPMADSGPVMPDAGSITVPIDSGFVPAPFDAGPSSTDYFFCDPITLGGVTDGSFGYTGCCTSTAFPTADHVEPGMLVKGSDSRIYYIATDGNRYPFPTSHFLTSWYLDPSRPVPFGDDDYACSLVVQIPDTLLVSLRIVGNAPMRPGVIVTGITVDPKRYVIDHGNVLREVDDLSIDLKLAESWLTGREIRTPDGYFITFCMGGRLSTTRVPYDGGRFYHEATIEYEIDHFCGR